MQPIIEVCRAIVGMGPQGITLAAKLTAIGEHDFIVIDPYDRPGAILAERFKDCRTAHLRSGMREHCAPTSDDLATWCNERGRLAELYDSRIPHTGLFVDHMVHVAAAGIPETRKLKAWVTWLQRAQDGRLQLFTNRGLVVAQEVHLCLGQPSPFYPEWAAALRGHNPLVSHIFDADYELTELPPAHKAVVVGGGITATQVAASLAETSDRQVTLVTRRPLSRGEGVTSSVSWLDPERRAALHTLPRHERNALLLKEGDKGTVPPWELERLEQLKRSGRIIHMTKEISVLAPTNSHVCLITRYGETIQGDMIVLATGLESRLPDWLVSAAIGLGLPFDEFGPVLCDDLSWGAGVFLFGPQSRLVVGPFAPNISGGMIGAELVAERIQRGK